MLCATSLLNHFCNGRGHTIHEDACWCFISVIFVLMALSNLPVSYHTWVFLFDICPLNFFTPLNKNVIIIFSQFPLCTAMLIVHHTALVGCFQGLSGGEIHYLTYMYVIRGVLFCAFTAIETPLMLYYFSKSFKRSLRGMSLQNWRPGSMVANMRGVWYSLHF